MQHADERGPPLHLPHFQLLICRSLQFGTDRPPHRLQLLQDILITKVKRGNPDQPMAVKTLFGWVLMGCYKAKPEQHSSQPTLVGHIAPTPSPDENSGRSKRYSPQTPVIFRKKRLY